jgi:hypothetical protein
VPFEHGGTAIHAGRHGRPAQARKVTARNRALLVVKDAAGDRGGERRGARARCPRRNRDQDAHVAGYILERGRAVVIAVNKWDAADREARERIKVELGWKIAFLGFAQLHFISAKDGKGLRELMRIGGCRVRLSNRESFRLRG